MEFREACMFTFVLLLSGAAALNETLHLKEQKTTGHHSNWSGRSSPPRSPVSYRLKVHEIWNPAVRKHQHIQDSSVQSFHTPQRWEARELTSEQLEEWENIQVKKFLTLIRGPNLNPPVTQETKVEVKFEKRVPVPAESVAVRCGEGEVTVEVKQNFLGNAQLIHPGDLTLGGCAAVDSSNHVLMFKTELQGCNSTMTMTEDALVYSFSLIYSPTPIGNTFILKTNHAEVGIQCLYMRKHQVSSSALRPTWSAFASNALAKQHLHFSLRLMTEDWQAQRASSVYFLSDVMHIEAAVLQGHHVPLRVYVDSCVATVTPDLESELSYPFIRNHGCLSDAKLTGAKSYFMQQSQEDKLHFQLKAFRFQQDHRNTLYITCRLKATSVSVPIDAQHKACSYLMEANRWVASGGDNKVCDCCESSCSLQRRRRSPAAHVGVDPEPKWEGVAVIGPILVEENILQVEFLREEAPQLQTADSSPSLALLCGAGGALAAALLLLMGAVICGRRHKPTEHAVCT
ncbi:zona pellucida sperm-binding protein 3-like [Halichoeres trimaculatus]|uniref:zona pellucida sperm-binding protein 3-like n=1 Tax=Halichoeres trimaculatus TaxID=147232 RepID=UPI003D9E424F